MPVPLLIALLLAFGTGSARPATGPIGPVAIAAKAGDLGFAICGVGVLGLATSAVVAARARREGPGSIGPERALAAGSRLVGAATLGAYAWAILGLGWGDLVDSGLGLRDAILVDEVLILLPFVLMQAAGWWGLVAGERAADRGRIVLAGPPGAGRVVVRKLRASLGLVLPSALIYATTQDVFRRGWPAAAAGPVGQVGLLAATGLAILAISPAFVRLAWPMAPLGPGPLRDRLERLAARFDFRCTDILVWDTGGRSFNAGVVGLSARFRYVLLTDALVAGMDERAIAAIFGHEVGHVRHHHLAYFGFALAAGTGVVALGSDLAMAGLAGLGLVGGPGDDPTARRWATLGLAIGYLALILGVLSRRFERQADVFGCRAASCGRPDCPPHLDVDARPGPPSAVASQVPICPVGLATFAAALARVARLAGVDPAGRSWRHGSMADRIAFLGTLEGRPEAERRFQARTLAIRAALAFGLIVALGLAFATGAIDQVVL